MVLPDSSLHAPRPHPRAYLPRVRALHEPAGEGDRLLAARDVARIDGGLELADDPAELRSGLDSELGRELVTRYRRAGRPVATPVECGREHLAREVEVRLDHLRSRDRSLPTGGEAIGDGQQRHVRRDRVRVAQVLVFPTARERPFPDQEPESQVMERKVLQLARQPATRLQPLAQPAHDRGALAVVADERDVVAVHAPRCRLAEVVNDGTEAQRSSSRQLVGERLVQELRDLGSAFAGEALEVGFDLQQLAQHFDGVAVDVEVMIRILFNAAQGLQLRQHRARGTQLVHELEPADRIVPGDQQAELPELTLAGRLRASRSARPPRGSTGAAAGSASGTATELMVKSRNARSCSIDSPRSAVTSTCQLGPSTRHVPNSSERLNAVPPTPRARSRATSLASTATARSTSTTARPSAASRTAPPTTHTPSSASSESRAARTAGAAASESASGELTGAPCCSSLPSREPWAPGTRFRR